MNVSAVNSELVTYMV